MGIFISRTNVAGGAEQPRPRRRVGCLGGCLIFFAIYFICSAILGWLMGDMFSSSSAELKDKTVYRLQLDGTLIEQAQEENPFAELMGSVPYYSNYANENTVGLDEILSNIRLAKNDDKILGIWLDGGSLATAPANAKAIRDALLDFKTSGKWVLASAKNYGQTNYYIASVADRICLDPTGAEDVLHPRNGEDRRGDADPQGGYVQVGCGALLPYLDVRGRPSANGAVPRRYLG